MRPLGEDPRDRARELLIDRALFGLGPREAAELEALLARFPELDDGSWERAAAALALGLLAAPEPPPPDLYRRLLPPEGRA